MADGCSFATFAANAISLEQTTAITPTEELGLNLVPEAVMMLATAIRMTATVSISWIEGQVRTRSIVS